MNIKKTLSYFFALIIIACTFNGCSSKGANALLSFAEYEPVCVENAFYKLNISDEGMISLISKESAQELLGSSTEADDTVYIPSLVKSAIAVTIYTPSSGEEIVLDSSSSSVASGGLTVRREQDEFVAEYEFVGSGLTVPVHYTLLNNRLAVTIIPTEIRMEEDVMIKSIVLHPYLAAGEKGEDGFLVVPDGSGALIHFNNQTAHQYNQKIYGTDRALYRVNDFENAQSVVMPTFGIGNITDKRLCLGVITAGAADASIEAEAGNGQTGYNGAWAHFDLLSQDIRHYTDYRPDVKMYAEEIKDTGPLQVCYIFKESEEPTYTQLAKLYREYLVERYDLAPIEDGSTSIAVDLVMASIKKKTVLGIPYNGVETLTSYEEGKQIVEQFASNNIPTVLRLMNWSSQTAWSKPLSGISLLGSSKSFNDLINVASNNGKVYLSANISEVYSGGGILPQKFAYAKDMRGAAAQYQHFDLVTHFSESEGHYLLSNKNVTTYAVRFGKSLKNLNLNIGVAIDGLNTIYTDFGAQQKSMSATVGVYADVMEELKGKGLNIAANGGNEFAFSTSEFMFMVPSESSNFDSSYDSIPFYQIAVHGLIPYSSEPVNLSADTRLTFLKAIETGSILQYRLMFAQAEAARYSRDGELYSATYEYWAQIIEEQYNEWSSAMGDRVSLEIVDHEKLSNGVYKTDYSDGSAVIVNYNDKQYVADDVAVDALSFCVLKGGE